MPGFKEALCENRTLFQHMSNGRNLFSQILWGTKPHAGTQSWCQFRRSVWNWSPYSGYQTRNICPNCLSTSQNPHDVALGRKLFSPLEIDVTKDLNKSIMVLLDTTSTCNKPPKKIAQSLIPLGHTMKNYLTHSKATLLTYDNSDLKPMGKRQATFCFWLKLCKSGTG